MRLYIIDNDKEGFQNLVLMHTNLQSNFVIHYYNVIYYTVLSPLRFVSTDALCIYNYVHIPLIKDFP